MGWGSNVHMIVGLHFLDKKGTNYCSDFYSHCKDAVYFFPLEIAPKQKRGFAGHGWNDKKVGNVKQKQKLIDKDLHFQSQGPAIPEY